MNTLRDSLAEYLDLRRSLGFKLEDAALKLPSFVAFVEGHDSTHITTALALAWAQQSTSVQPAEWARRLGYVRGFARHRSATDVLTEVPPLGLLPHRSTRARPYLYSDDEVQRLLDAALMLPTTWHSTPLRPWVFYCLFGLLSATGMRISEALSLHVGDVDLDQSRLTIRGAKLGKTRLVPLHATTGRVLADYLRRREACCHPGNSPYVFVSTTGNRLDQAQVHRTFYALSRQIGLRGCQPRAAHPRPAASLRGSRTDAVVSGGRGRRALTAGVVDLHRSRACEGHVLVLERVAGVDGRGDVAPGAALGGDAMTSRASFATLLEAFFTQRLTQQRQASAHTIASYRDTFRMLLQFTHKRLRKVPSTLTLEDIDAPVVAAFLDDLEAVRGVTARTRNLRLTAVHSFFRYASYEAPTHAAQIARVLAIPAKKFDRALVGFLSRTEVDALLAAPHQRTWSGRRDHALMLLAVQTGLRLSELIGLRRDDVQLGTGSHVRVIGKGARSAARR